MTHTHSQPSKLYVSDITQYSDVELDQYLKRNERSKFNDAFYIAIMLRLRHKCIQLEDSKNLFDHFIQRLKSFFRLTVISFSFSNITVTESEQSRATSHFVRLTWTMYSHVLSMSQWSKLHHLDHSLLTQLYVSTVRMKTISVNIKIRRWDFTINLYRTTIDSHIRSVLIMMLSEIQKNIARSYHLNIHVMMISMLEWYFQISWVSENVFAIINDMWENQIASLSTVNDYMIVWENMSLSDHFSWMRIRINRANWRRESSFLTESTDNTIVVRMCLVVNRRDMTKSERSSWTRRSWNHLRQRSCCEISPMRCSYEERNNKLKRLQILLYRSWI
jgi:hypothetical protein